MADVKRKRRWMPVVLTLSLALNLAVVAALMGAAWRHKDVERSPRASRGGAIYMQALPREVRREMFRNLRAAMPPPRDSAEMVAILRQEPFDRAAAQAVLASERDASLLRQDAASAAWLAYIADLPVAERAAYADRLQEIVARRTARKAD